MVQNWTALHRAAHERNFDALEKYLTDEIHPITAVDSSHIDMRTALSIASSDSYPLARPVCERCLALFQPRLVKGVASSSRGGGGGGGGGGGEQTES